MSNDSQTPRGQRMTAPTPDTTAGERACDCDYWHSAHRWHCSINYAAALAPDTAGESA